MPNQPDIVDREFVKAAGLIRPFELEGLDALYPELFDKSVSAVSARFAGRGVASGQVDLVRGHVAALVIAELWRHLGTRPLDIEGAIQEKARAAEDWLASAQPLQARVSAAPAALHRTEPPKS